MTLPAALRAYLSQPDLSEIWTRLRDRLERTGHAVRGSIRVDIGEQAAECLSGILGRPIAPGSRSLSLPELDAALVRSTAACGLVPVVAELTGAALRDRPSERLARQAVVADLWEQVERTLVDTQPGATPVGNGPNRPGSARRVSDRQPDSRSPVTRTAPTTTADSVLSSIPLTRQSSAESTV